MVLRQLGTYATVMGLAYQSSRLQASMSAHLVKMGEEAARAAQLQAAADSDLTLSGETADKATADRAEGEGLQQQAQALFVKADEDKAMAATEEAVADGEEAKAAEEEEQAVGHFAEAGSLQGIVDADRIEAVADSAAASRAEFTARGDELGMGVCEMVPLLDVVCDLVGGTAAVGLEATAAKEAAESAALIVAAAEAEAKEKSELALAVELQSAAAEDGELAAADHASAAEVEAEAEAELAQAEEEEAAAQEKLAQSTAEEEAAEQENVEALAEEEQSDASFAKSAEYGVAACWDACWGSLLGALAFGFFALRLIPAFVMTATTYVPRVAASGFNALTMRRVSQGYHHCAVFGLVLGAFGGLMIGLDSLHYRARGGIVLLFALSAAILNALLVHALPKMWSRNEERALATAKLFALEFLYWLGFLFPLFVFEFLILRVSFREGLISEGTINWLQQWYLWAVFALTLFAHHWFLERQVAAPSSEVSLVQVSAGSDSPSLNSASASSYGTVTNVSLPSSLETIPLTSSVSTEQRSAPRSSSWRVAALNYFQQYRLPLDLLIAACAFAVLRTCLPNVRHLWPVSKTIILAAHPHWWIVAVCVVVPLVAVGAFWLYRKRHTP